MTWEQAAKELGRRPITIVEIDLDYCQLRYGVGDCPAVLGVDSVAKCYQTRRTCPVPAAYDPVARTYRFSNRELGYLTLSLPCLINTTFTSTKIDPGRSMGTRASAQVKLQDMSWADRDLDPYVSTRPYDPEEVGTFFGRLLARNPYYQNRVMRIKCGYLDDDGTVDLSKFQTQTFLLDRIEGPDANGVVTLHAIDVLRLADDEKSLVPQLSNGTIDADINSTDTTVTLLPAGIGDEEYPLFGVAAMDDEVVNFSRTGDVVTLNLRGAQFSPAQDHEIGTTFQVCKVYDDVPVADVLYELLTVNSPVPAAFIDKAAWDDECDTWLSGHMLNCTIAIPTGVNVLINELIATCLLYIWWDGVAALIRLRAIRPQDPSLQRRILTDDDSFVAGSLSITEDPAQRISQFWAHYARKNPLLKMDEYRNFAKNVLGIDGAAEGSAEYGERRIRRMPCRFFSAENQSQAVVLGARMLARYRDNPRTFKFDLDAKDADILVGDVVEVHTKVLQGIDGLPITTNMQILRRTEKKEGDRFSYEASDTFFSGRYGFILPTGTLDYLAATEAQRNKGCFIAQDDGLMPNGDPGYKII